MTDRVFYAHRGFRHLMGAAVASLALALPGALSAQDSPQSGGMVRINVHAEVPNFDPLASTEFGKHSRLGLALSKLIDWTTGPDIGYGQFVPEPALAKSWEISEDGLTYTLHLREDVVWQDVAPVSGRPFTAEDVLATFEAMRNGGVQEGLLADVAEITAPDDHTVVLRLNQRNVVLLQNLAHQNMWILPKEAFDGTYDRNTTVIGTGPWIMTDNQPGVATRYERNPTYFGKAEDGTQLPYLDSVEILPITDLNARIMAFRSGQVDIWFGPLNMTQMAAIQKQLPDLNDIRTVSNTQTELYLNPAFEPFSDLRVRQAINMAIDRQALGEVIRGGGELGGVVGPALSAQTLPKDERIALYGTPDAEGARALLAEAGYPDGFSFELTALNYGEEFMREAEWIQQDLAEIGVTAELRMIDKLAGMTLGQEGGFEALFLVMSPFAEADEYLSTHYLPGANRNYSKVDDPELTAMIEEQRTIADPEARQQKLWEIQRYIAENVQTTLPIWASELLHPSHARVHDWRPMMPQGFPSLTEVWVSE